MSDMQRREFLTGAAGLAAAATAALAGTRPGYGRRPAAATRPRQQGAPIIGPSNPSRQAQSPDRVSPPATDSGTLPTLRWSFTDSHIKMREGGWSRQTTIREIPVSTDLALVNMRLKAGGVRELHWHKPAEWAFMLKGRARITAIDEHGRAFQDDVSEGDLWNFPSGIPHSIQGLEGDGCEFLLVFDDGNFSEDSTFSVTDWLAHTPREVLAKNFGVPETAFAGIPEKELFIFQSKVPWPARRGPRRRRRGVAHVVQLPAAGPGADPHGGRYGPHLRLDQFPGGDDDLRRVCRSRARRHARAALAPQCQRGAVLHLRPGADDGLRR